MKGKLVIIILLFFCSCEDLTNNEKQNPQLIFSTDKEIYSTSENIKIKIENNLDSSILFGLRCYQHPEISYQKKQGNSWSENLNFWWESLKCATILDTLVGNSKYEYEIIPEIFDASLTSNKRLDIGIYRFSLGFTTLYNGKQYLSYSNIFEIK